MQNTKKWIDNLFVKRKLSSLRYGTSEFELMAARIAFCASIIGAETLLIPNGLNKTTDINYDRNRYEIAVLKNN